MGRMLTPLTRVTEDAQPDTDDMLDARMKELDEKKIPALTPAQRQAVARMFKKVARDAQDIQLTYAIAELREDYLVTARRMPEATGHTCGRMTTSGKPCKAQGLIVLAHMDPAYIQPCSTHRTPEEEALRSEINAAVWESRRWDAENEEAIKKSNKEKDERFERERLLSLRTMDEEGRQIVQVGKLAYTWSGKRPLRVGDVVEVPGNWLFKGRRTEPVTNLGTTYDGDLQDILRLVTPREDVTD